MSDELPKGVGTIPPTCAFCEFYAHGTYRSDNVCHNTVVNAATINWEDSFAPSPDYGCNQFKARLIQGGIINA